MMRPHARHKGYAAFLGHRLSGLALALFLPFHFMALGLALNGAERLDGFLTLVDNPVFKFAEWGLVMLLALHMFFGLRLLALEFLPWPQPADGRGGWIVPGAVAAGLVGLVFLVQVV